MRWLWVLALGLGLVACGGGGSTPLEEYFDLLLTPDDVAGRVDASLPDDTLPDQEFVEQLRVFLRAAGTNFPMSRLRDIEPPAEAEAAHSKLVGAIRGFTTGSLVAERRLGETSDREVAVAIVLSEIAGPVLAVEQACFELQEIADANDISRDLKCHEIAPFPSQPSGA